MKLLVVIPVIEAEKKILLYNYNLLCKKLNICEINNYRIVIIYQTEKNQDKQINELCNNVTEVYFSNVFNVSSARNYGLSKLIDEDYIYFLDSGAMPSVNFLKKSKELMENNYKIWFGAIKWTSDFDDTTIVNKNNDENKIQYIKSYKIMYKTFMWAYIFKASLLVKHNLLFNESIGLSKHNKLQGGEDTLFYYDVIMYNKINEVVYLKSKVFHYPRDNSYSKQLKYSEGQGAMHRYLLSRKMPFRFKIFEIIYFFLFIVNTILRVFLLKPNSLKMAKLRLKGFIENKIEHNYA